MPRVDDQGIINLNWAMALLDRLASAGVRHVFAAPGSRSTPLVLAASLHPDLIVDVHFDERGTAFMALGAARETGLPSAWITTSGTAVANGMPAVVEANVDGIPLILLTADRPPELRHTGANQTIDQVEFFGRQVRWFADVPAPDLSTDLGLAARYADRAMSDSAGANPGPVHLNCMFREPLAPATLDGYVRPDTRPAARFGRPSVNTQTRELDQLRELVAGSRSGLIVAGRLAERSDADRIARIAGALDWPVLPDILSGLRAGAEDPRLISHYDLVLAAGAAPSERPDLILHFGDRPVSKRLDEYLSSSASQVVNVRRDGRPLVHSANDINIRADVATIQESLRGAELKPDGAWLQTWINSNDVVKAFLEEKLPETGFSEPVVARGVLSSLGESDSLVIGSSMPIRDADMFAAAGGLGPAIFANRGASGIDGTIATAVGIARASGRPMTVLLGDLSLLHDLNSLAAIRNLEAPFRVVVVNNDGGGIFSMLPVRSLTEVFEPLFGTPHGLTFEDAAKMFGLAYHRPESPADLIALLANSASEATHAMIEVRTARGSNADLHRRIIRELKARFVDAG
jgi:2-succinyl-5-enolpyruvyl-6-hydroxy-3-cyclohexene-1-carboxylate synthase